MSSENQPPRPHDGTWKTGLLLFLAMEAAWLIGLGITKAVDRSGGYGFISFGLFGPILILVAGAVATRLVGKSLERELRKRLWARYFIFAGLFLLLMFPTCGFVASA